MQLEDPMDKLKKLKHDITRFMLIYKFALDEMETKIEILKQEFQALHDYSPIEHTKSRLKSPESIMNKMLRKNSELSLDAIKDSIKDIAGLRITCSFISDIYDVSNMLQRQSDLKVLEIKDYIKNPKPNGYQSLHLLVQVPVFMSDCEELVCVEVQIRTIAMDFWASLEHKIFYKYNQSVPESLTRELKNAADSANALDLQMERLHREIKEIKDARGEEDSMEELRKIMINNQQITVPANFLKLLGE
ncbi:MULTISPECIES: GTP pyrophosphokinase family protein [Paenibacillus]|uniref:GTP pyrophosphokinase n=1 Tax=Paenibacillus polymyxa (strain SC2) TaxID=886882 RepID=E3E6M9_PAEPS|nr:MULTISPECIES: GTP pyrophosphokinase family protein [Paenibacillus]ADO58289.1 GTP pyrophosphokinase [Paenibacillus polymyxa SC2]AJE52608.1 GTP pyrophosphokinase [Paenibacillus polymyxa]AZH30979.1 GTP pyrophosphokinase family protein [Paenibacillus sp. M-152]KAF6564007.1 GTP pyrophosphokinase family protein [Paenibacillus sp. EKM202P]KAF6571053.1 GTP pyrophosphokinase family protein [Paenibacillus sp. EKM207P]